MLTKNKIANNISYYEMMDFSGSKKIENFLRQNHQKLFDKFNKIIEEENREGQVSKSSSTSSSSSEPELEPVDCKAPKNCERVLKPNLVALALKCGIDLRDQTYKKKTKKILCNELKNKYGVK